MATFLIKGEFITDHCRDRVFDFEWEDGLRFLSNSVPEITYAQSVEILSGRKAFDGDSRVGMRIVDETPERRKETTRRYGWKYAGIFYDRPNKKHWRPYAYIQGWSAEDMVPCRVPNRYIPYPAGKMVSEICGGAMSAWGRFRCVYYMDDVIEDNMFHVVVPVPGERDQLQCVLWRAVPSPPLWWKQVTTPQEAVIEYLAAGERLEERGANKNRRTELTYRDALKDITIPTGPPREDAVIAMPAGVKLPDERKPNLIRDLLEERGLSPETVDGLHRALTDTGDYQMPEPTKDVSAARWAWIDRSGNLWPCRGYMDHIPLAEELCRKFGIQTFKNPSKALENAGWAKVGVNNEGNPYAYCDRQKRTTSQREVIKNWLITHQAAGEQISRWINEGDGHDY